MHQKNKKHLNHHIKPQIEFCGLRSTRFDFVGKLERMGLDFVNFTESIGIWDKFGKSGWGDSHKDPFIDSYAYRYKPYHSEDKIWKYYTKDMLKKVYAFYKEDAERFGYSLEELLKEKPKN